MSSMRRFSVVHAIAACRDCAWESQHYKTAKACAARHARAQQHVVDVEVGLAGIYDGRRPPGGAKPVSES